MNGCGAGCGAGSGVGVRVARGVGVDVGVGANPAGVAVAVTSAVGVTWTVASGVAADRSPPLLLATSSAAAMASVGAKR